MKSSGFQPEAKEIPTRPPDKLSTIDHSSVMRMGLWSGATTLPALSCSRLVVAASAACRTAGFGSSEPNSVKCRSGTHKLEKPWLSAKRALSRINWYLLPDYASSLLAKNMRLNFMALTLRWRTGADSRWRTGARRTRHRGAPPGGSPRRRDARRPYDSTRFGPAWDRRLAGTGARAMSGRPRSGRRRPPHRRVRLPRRRLTPSPHRPNRAAPVRPGVGGSKGIRSLGRPDAIARSRYREDAAVEAGAARVVDGSPPANPANSGGARMDSEAERATRPRTRSTGPPSPRHVPEGIAVRALREAVWRVPCPAPRCRCARSCWPQVGPRSLPSQRW